MAKRSRKQYSPGQLTPKEARHRRRDLQQQRTLLLGAGAVIVAIIAILGFGYYRENIATFRAPVAVVNGQTITVRDYQDMVRYQRFNLIVSFGAQIDQATLASFLQNQLPVSVFDDMIEQVLVEQYAAEQGITVSDEEVQQAIEQRFGAVEELPTPAASADASSEAIEPTETTNREESDTAFRNYLETLKTQTGLSESQYRKLLRGELLRGKVREQVVADVPTHAHQVHARHILVETEEEAQQARQRLLDGEDFAAVAEEVSTDPGSATDGGDLGWFGLGQMVPEFEKVAFSLPTGQISEPVKTDFGYHIIEVLERDENRELTAAQLSQAQEERYQEWLDEQKAASDIQRSWSPDVVPPLPGATSNAP